MQASIQMDVDKPIRLVPGAPLGPKGSLAGELLTATEPAMGRLCRSKQPPACTRSELQSALIQRLDAVRRDRPAAPALIDGGFI